MINGVITLLTDFGTRDAYVGVMKGVMLGICPSARFVDLTHEVPPQAVLVGALVLRSSVEHFPPGAIHLAIVDPGVGSSRRAVAVVTERAIFVGPDNGLLYPAATRLGIVEVRRLEREEYLIHPVSQTFHGRDLFAPVAAHLASGVSPQDLGPVQPELEPLPVPEPWLEGGELRGEVIYADHFGNLITNISVGALVGFPRRGLSVSIGQMRISEIVPAYASVPEGSPLAIIGSWNLLEIAVRNGNAAERLGASTGSAVVVRAG